MLKFLCYRAYGDDITRTTKKQERTRIGGGYELIELRLTIRYDFSRNYIGNLLINSVEHIQPQCIASAAIELDRYRVGATCDKSVCQRIGGGTRYIFLDHHIAILILDD